MTVCPFVHYWLDLPEKKIRRSVLVQLRTFENDLDHCLDTKINSGFTYYYMPWQRYALSECSCF